MIRLLVKLWMNISRWRKIQYLFLILLVLLSTLADAVSISAVVPFLVILYDPNSIHKINGINFVIFDSLANIDHEQRIYLFSTLFISLLITSGVIRVFWIWFSTKFAFACGTEISESIFCKTLNQSYEALKEKKTSEIINAMTNSVNAIIFWVILPILNLISCFFLVIVISITLIYINHRVAFVVMGGFGGAYLLISIIFKKRLLQNGFEVTKRQQELLQFLQEGLGSVRDVILDGTQNYYVKCYGSVDKKLRDAYSINNFIGGAPRPIVEILGMIIIVVVAIWLTLQSNEISESLPVLAALALGAQRLLPALQQGFNAWANLIGGKSALISAFELLDQPTVRYKRPETLSFHEIIEINNINFSYKNSDYVILENASFKIKKGSCIGIIGKSGSGKSTLLDIVMGLLYPVSGNISIDGNIIEYSDIISWRNNISHVPQSIFLIDGSFAENIAIGERKEKIDFERMFFCAKICQIHEYIVNSKDGYKTSLGESGGKLSGGQRQRVGIARALYKNKEILVLDEATSALDIETEALIINQIKKHFIGLTIIIVSHSKETLKHCESIYTISSKNIMPIREGGCGEN